MKPMKPMKPGKPPTNAQAYFNPMPNPMPNPMLNPMPTETDTDRPLIAVAVLASFVAFLDGSVINLALPAIGRELSSRWHRCCPRWRPAAGCLWPPDACRALARRFWSRVPLR